MKIRGFKHVLGACLLTAAATQAFGWGWVTGEGGYAPDYNRVDVSAGSSLDKAETLIAQGEIGEGRAHNGTPVQDTKATDYNLGLGYFPAANWDVSLDSNLSYDSSDQRSSGGDLVVGVHKDLEWCKPSLTLSGGANSYVLTVNGVDQDLTGTQLSAAFGLGLGEYFSLGASGTDYSYSSTPYSGPSASSTTLNPADSGGFQPFLRPWFPAPGGSQVGQESGSVRNPLLFGFPSKDWAVGLTVTLPMAGSTLSANYSQIDGDLNDIWVKSVGAAFRQELGKSKDFAIKLGWCKAVESGSDAPFFSGGLTMYFGDSGKGKEKATD